MRGKDGRLTAYAAVEGAVLRWTEKQPGGPDWSGPETIPAPGNDPHVCIAQGADGYVHLVGLRRTRGDGGRPVTEVVYALQYQSGLAVRSWETVGNPFPDDPEAAARIGPPSAVVDATGSLHVFVSDPGGGVRHRAQVASGKWNRWADLGGLRITGRVSPALLDDGLMELLAPTPQHLMRWTQPGAGVKFTRAPDVPAAPEPASLSRVATGPGRLTHLWHDRGDRTVRAWRAAAGDEPADPVPLGDAGGSGPIALLRTRVDGHDCTVMVRRDDATGRPAIAAYPTEEESLGASWTPTGEPCLGAPALAPDARGRVVVAAFATDGSLRVARQKAEPGLALDAWTAV
ncbi:hypothetical protein [Streptomyces solincola]|uniref:hypothetical protein n=1 Tax=Streptomyces solincola TaxID=2100817 RepID=UPI0021593221|nr:hypothetical protein [Streptomyces solincola]